MGEQVLVGLLVDCREDWSLRAERGLLVVRGERIVERAEESDLPTVLATHQGAKVVVLGPDEFVLPGLVDTHIHASQFPNAGLALDLTLLDWLERYTFPTERGLAQLPKAQEVYGRCVRTTLSSGTTTACYFATIHREPSLALARTCADLGQRALIGKVCMDRNSPPDYSETTAASLAETEAFCQEVLQQGSPLVRPVVTPRFVPTCSRPLLEGLAALAARQGLHIQSHLAENQPECRWVKELEPDCQSYTEVYHRAGLLTPRTVLAHCVHLSQDEIELIRETGAGVSHCPNSNFSLKSGVCDVQRLRAAGVKVGLGTDCSGGYSPSLLNAMRMAVTASNSLACRDTAYTPLQFSDALYLATRGGAEVLDMQGELGALQPGMQADLLRVNMANQEATKLFGQESAADRVSKFVFLGDDRNIAQVWVSGRLVKDGLAQ